MIFEFQNIGPIEKASIELGNLTLICGENNTGKTYLSYGIYGFFANWGKLLFESVNFYIRQNFSAKIQANEIVNFNLVDLKKYLENEDSNKLGSDYLALLKNVFSINESEFKKSKVNLKNFITIDANLWSLWKKEIKNLTTENDFDFFEKDVYENYNISFICNEKTVNIQNTHKKSEKYMASLHLLLNTKAIKIFSKSIPQAFILSPERFITRLFLPEIDKNRSDLVNTILQNGSNSTNEDLEDKVGRYSLPIKDNIDFARDLTYTTKQSSFLQTEHPEVLTVIEDMLGIEYVVRDGRLLVFDKKTERMLPFDMASTSVRSLADLHLWLKHKAQKGNVLFIDEPELSLHPANQIKLMRLLVRLVNVGVKVFMTTHSDYMVKELNNLLKLSHDFPNKEKVIEELGYQQKDILQASDLRAYITENQTTRLLEIDELGMLTSAFDDAIIQINESSNKLTSIIEDVLAAQ